MDFKDIKIGDKLKNKIDGTLHEVLDIGFDWLSNCNYITISIIDPFYKSLQTNKIHRFQHA